MLLSDTNPAFHGAIVSILRDAGLSPTFDEVGERRVEHALLAVASGAGIALLPESAARAPCRARRLHRSAGAR
jgi:DNA-binding transcriptional LysR family regulator